MTLQDAIRLCRENGYSVAKPKARKAKAKVEWPLPVAQASFANGATIRMSVYTLADNPDEARGRNLCLEAFRLRHGFDVPCLLNFHYTKGAYAVAPFEGDRLAA